MDKKQPNIALIVLDSARRDMFGCYGGPDLTPHIDALAARSLVLQDHYASGCGSAQAHVGLFLGQHSARHGKVHNLSELQGEIKALPTMLRKRGYRCYGHCMVSFIPPAGYEDEFGFDDFYYPEKYAEKTAQSPAVKDRILDRLRNNSKLWGNLRKVYRGIVGQEGVVRAAARRFDGRKSLDYMVEKLKQAEVGRPIFAYTTLLHPHTPYYPPQWCRDQIFQKEKPERLSFEIQNNMHAWANGNYGAASSAIESMKKMYQAELLYADHLVGGFVERLQREGLLDDTILIITSDHGELFGDDGYLNHGLTVREELHRLPCIIHFPRRFAKGQTLPHLTSALDILPTIFDLLGEADFPTGESTLDGASVFNSTVVNQARRLVVDSPPVVLPERLKEFPRLIMRSNVFYRAVRSEEFKYVWLSNGTRYLFPVGGYESPENSILAEQQSVADELHEEMVRFYRGIDATYDINQYPLNIGSSAGVKMKNPLIRDELIKLGYL